MENTVPESILEFIKGHGAFVIVGHKEPDGDCIGSQLALASFLTRLGKKTALCSAGPFKRTEIKDWEPRFSSKLPEDFKRLEPACIVLDCSNIGRVGSLEEEVRGLPLAFIDHHATGEASGQAVFIEPEAQAVTILVQRLIEAMGEKPTTEEAEYLLFGLCTDTGFFRHLDEGGAPALGSALRLAQAGASPKKAFSRMYGGKSLNSRLLMGRILSRIEAYFDGRVLYSYETLEDTLEFGLEGRDSDMLYQLMQSISGCEAIMLVRQESEDTCTIGLRSKEKIDVGAIAAGLGGGGHRLASGLAIKGRIPDVKIKLLAAFEESLLPPS
jgi:bifunctional oligoribonuclease and PAP phosphatase NrnA